MLFFLFCLGLVFLVVGAELLVRGAAALAAAMGVSPLVVGLTVVSIGTSAPELAVSIQASFHHQGDLALGNVVGSNIANILLILGLAAVIAPLMVEPQLVRLDVPLMIGASILTYLLAWDGFISRLDGGLLFVCAVVYTVFTIYQSRRESAAVAADMAAEFPVPPKRLRARAVALYVFYILIGLVGLVQGANWIVDGAVAAAKWMGVSEMVVGLTVVAIGTSLPEIAATLVAVSRGQREMAVGNAVGSNLFNLFGVLGAAGLAAPEPILVPGNALVFDLPVMCAVAVACLPIFVAGRQIARWEAVLFLFYYAAYLTYLVLAAGEHTLLENFRIGMVWFVLPLTVVGLAASLARSLHLERRTRREAAARNGT